MKPEDDLLLFAQLGNMSGNGYPMDQEPSIIEVTNEQQRAQQQQMKEDDQNENKDSNQVTPVRDAPLINPNADQRSHGNGLRYKFSEGRHVKVWECSICRKEFAHQYTLMRHWPTHTNERKFLCNICGKAFRQMSTLSQHKAIHSTERPHVCEICHKDFNRVSTLISHRKTHNGAKPHKCNICKKAFHQKGNLRNHIFTHTNARPYKCDICYKGFNQMSNLMCHKMKTHQRAEKPKYSCSVCGMSFLKRVALRHHELYTHGVTIQKDNDTAVPIGSAEIFLDEPIATRAMQICVQTKRKPFALLRLLNGVSVLVQVAEYNRHVLIPATAKDLEENSYCLVNGRRIAAPNFNFRHYTKVRIQIPIVAKIIQLQETGSVSMKVLEPDQVDMGVDEGVANSDSANKDRNMMSVEISPNEEKEGKITVEYVDEHGNMIQNSFTTFDSHETFQPDGENGNDEGKVFNVLI